MRMICGPALPGLALAFSCCGPAAAHEVDLSLNSHAVRVSYGTPVGDGLRLEGGWLHDSDEGDVTHAGYLVLPQAEVYMGARYVGADYDNRPSIRFDTGMHAGFNLRF